MKKTEWFSVSVYRNGELLVWNDRGEIIFKKTDRFIGFLMDAIVKTILEEAKRQRGGD